MRKTGSVTTVDMNVGKCRATACIRDKGPYRQSQPLPVNSSPTAPNVGAARERVFLLHSKPPLPRIFTAA